MSVRSKMKQWDCSMLSSMLSSLVGLQLFSRLFTFFLNQSLLRLASPEAFGTASIQFDLLLSTILFLSREGVRNALLRSSWWSSVQQQQDGGKKNQESRGNKPEELVLDRVRPRVLNVAYLPLICGIPLAVIIGTLYSWRASNETRLQPYFASALALYTISAMLELAAEPMHNLAMAEMKTVLRVRAEGLGVTMRTTITFLALLYDNRTHHEGALALLAFSFGQLSYALSVLFVYTSHYGLRYLIPNISNSFDAQALQLSKTMTFQSLIKHILTEGDKFLLSWLTPLQDQGGYAVAVNYGSLIARIILQPIEETSRIYFSKASSSQEFSSSQASEKRASYAYLVTLIRTLLTLSLLLCTFAPPYLPYVLPFLLPSRYLLTSAPRILDAWVYYIPILALNGVLEAFHAGVASPSQVAQQSRYMTLFSAVFISSSIFLYTVADLGDISLVYANMINLVARILFCARFMADYFCTPPGDAKLADGAEFNTNWAKHCLPNKLVALTALISRVVIWVDEVKLPMHSYKYTNIEILIRHFGVGGVMGVGCVVIWWLTEGRPMITVRKSKKE